MTPRLPTRTGCWLSVIGLLALTVIAARALDRLAVAAPETADVTMDLPATLGDWTGEEVLYCQNEPCLRSFRLREIEVTNTCPICGGTLDRMALGENNILPPDTLIARKLYTHSRGDQLYATVVLSRSEQKSIHRPQQCLPAQGFTIAASRVMSIPLPGRTPVEITLLRARRGAGPSAGGTARIVFAYCFAGGGRETASHYRRLAWMAWDNLIHGYRARWAYVSIQTTDSGDPRLADARVTGFVRAFYPLIHRR